MRKHSPNRGVSYAKKRLPFSGEFSPGQVDLVWLLRLVNEQGKHRSEVVESIRTKYFSESALTYVGDARRVQQAKRAGNVLIGLRSYGLIRRDGRSLKLTSLGHELLRTPTADEQYACLASHILRRLGGIDVLQAIRVLADRGDSITKATLSAQLSTSGYSMPRATTKHLTLLSWLRLAGVLSPEGYTVDDLVVGNLIGAPANIKDDVELLGEHERLFLRALARFEPEESPLVSQVMEAAESLYGIRFPEDRWQAAVLRPLEEKGWIRLARGTTGRGAKSGRLIGTEKFQSEFAQKLLEEDAPALSLELRAGLRKNFAEIVSGLTTEEGENARHIRGISLELLAVRIAQYLDLAPRKWRLRSSQTGGAEVDLIVEGTRLLFSRWQIQCKNTRQVTVDDLAKELGLALLLKSHVILMVTTGKFGRTVLEYARKANEETHIQVITLDGALLEAIANSPSDATNRLTAYLNLQARNALQQKAPQLSSAD